MELYKPNKKQIDTRKRRRLYRFVKKVQRISAVILVWMVGVTVLYGVYVTTFRKPYFKVRLVEVRGDLRVLTEEKIVKDSGIKDGDHLLRMVIGDVQKKLARNPWIKEVAVHRKLPHMVLIYVKEYLPEAIVRLNGGWHYVDRFGEPFKKLDADDKKDYPIITGLEELPENDGKDQFKSRVVELLGVKKLYETSQLGEIYGLSEIHFSSKSGVSVITLNDPMELRLGFGPFVEKIERFETVYPAIRSHGGVVAYVDLNSEGKVVVKYGT